MPYLPPYLTNVRTSTNAPSSSESISYDYSGADEIQKRQDEARQLAVGRYGQLYGGDVAGSVGAGQRIRDLLSSIKDIAPVRVSSSSSSRDGGGGSSELSGTHDEPDEQRPAAPAGVVVKSRTPLAGNPQGFGNDGRKKPGLFA